MNLEEMSLAELFDAADEIGDKYLTAEEFAERDRVLKELASDLYAELTIEDRLDAVEAEVAAVRGQFGEILKQLEVLAKLVG